jgi:CRP-like cAMP-binding protein
MNKSDKTDLSYINTLWGNIFDKFIFSKSFDKLEVLKKIPLFAELNKPELKVISKIVYERDFEAGELMFKTGQPGAAMFIIKKGKVSIFQETSEGEAAELTKLKDGEFLGELALLDNSPRSASARALKNTHTLALFREDINGLIETRPFLAAKVMKQLAIVIGIRLKATNDIVLKLQDQLYKQDESPEENSITI